jgi:glycosyltransferase involved in cell wall biosynthesis
MSLRIAVVSLSAIGADSRILRTIGALLSAGYEVVTAGFGDSTAPGVVRHAALPVPVAGWRSRFAIAGTQAPAGLLPGLATYFHDFRRHHAALHAALAEFSPDIVHANDWPTLPSALRWKERSGARVVYDSHEFASEEHADRPAWRLLARAHVRAIESQFIGRTDAVVTVSDGIANALQAAHGLARLPTVIRNIPAFREIEPHPVGNPPRLLFHGLLKPARGIEILVEALAQLPGHHLTLRGSGPEAFIVALRARAAALGVSNRLSFEPFVPADMVVEHARHADIGVFCAPDRPLNNYFALPNKIFEYIMAGLMVVVSGGPDLARLVREHDCGEVVAEPSLAALASTLANLTPQRIASCQRASRLAAHSLCWEQESRKLVALYTNLPPSSQMAVSFEGER